VPGCDRAWAAAPHEDVARELVVALKFRRLLRVAETIARRIDALAPAPLLAAEFVPVAPSPGRLARRGFDPAEEIARCLGALAGAPVRRCLEREEGPRQVGRSRAARIARPPRPRVLGRPPANVVLVDDVQTTGATLAACTRALREAGSERVSALTFARTL
jgi:predicted amidophosphoribosyltransferase